MSATITRYLLALRYPATEQDREQAQRELWQRGYEAMVRFARRLLSRQDAEEVAADAFRRVFEDIRDRTDRGELHGSDFWQLLRTITRHGAITRLLAV